MKNKFKLQAVLDYRKVLEDQARQELARSLQQEADLLAHLAAEEQELTSLYEEFERRQQSGMSCDELRLYQNRISHKVETVARLVESLEKMQLQIARKRENVIEAGRDKKLLEKLKEKKTEAFQQEQRRKDNVALDEIATQQFRR